MTEESQSQDGMHSCTTAPVSCGPHGIRHCHRLSLHAESMPPALLHVLQDYCIATTAASDSSLLCW